MKHDSGIILVNVLVALALGAALVVLMFTSQDNLIDRTRRAAAASQAEALALGGEASVVEALYRDMIAAPETDNFTESWAAIQQAPVQLASGTFSVTITDAQALFDVNQLAGQMAGLVQVQTLDLLLAQAGLPPQVAQGIVRQLQADGPISDIAALRDIDPTARATLADLITALPLPGAVNLNTAPAPVLAGVLGNAAAASRLAALRDRQGFVTEADLAALGGLGVNGAGLTSDVYDVTVMAEVDGTPVTLTSRLVRLHATPNQREVLVVARRFGPVPR